MTKLLIYVHQFLKAMKKLHAKRFCVHMIFIFFYVMQSLILYEGCLEMSKYSKIFIYKKIYLRKPFTSEAFVVGFPRFVPNVS